MALSPKHASEFTTFRTIVADDSSNGAPTSAGVGINMAEYRSCIIDVAVTTQNPVVGIRFWSEAAGKFVDESTALTIAAKGAGVSYQTRVECLGRVMWVYCSGGVSGGTVVISVAGYRGA